MSIVCFYPQLFAAYRVLLRLLVPRHSPNALFFLTFVIFLITSNEIVFAYCCFVFFFVLFKFRLLSFFRFVVVMVLLTFVWWR